MAFTDQFAAYRNRQVAAKQRYGRTRSMNWGLWQAGGMGMDAASQERRQERLPEATGIQPMRTAIGLQAFYRSLELPCDQLVAAEGDLTSMRRALLTRRPIQQEPAPLPRAELPGCVRDRVGRDKTS